MFRVKVEDLDEYVHNKMSVSKALVERAIEGVRIANRMGIYVREWIGLIRIV